MRGEHPTVARRTLRLVVPPVIVPRPPPSPEASKIARRGLWRSLGLAADILHALARSGRFPLPLVADLEMLAGRVLALRASRGPGTGAP